MPSGQSIKFLVVTHDSIRWSVRPSVRPSVGPSVGPLRVFLVGQKRAKMSKNEISGDEVGRDEKSHDVFRVYELV